MHKLGVKIASKINEKMNVRIRKFDADPHQNTPFTIVLPIALLRAIVATADRRASLLPHMDVAGVWHWLRTATCCRTTTRQTGDLQYLNT